ncbi:thiamine pyrophosphate-dependent enzyme [Ralstonia sp. A12]|uniref:thiamine pyrophosphate-dependent enzyme n=1 Tax=Ralstonia sp. A12 TaxID=1217052 RepID=UPI000A064333
MVESSVVECFSLPKWKRGERHLLRLGIVSKRTWPTEVELYAVLMGPSAHGPRDELTVVVRLDASLLMNVGDLDTAARYQLPLSIVVLNDDGLGQKRHAPSAKHLPSELATLAAPNFRVFARAAGDAGVHCTRATDL